MKEKISTSKTCFMAVILHKGLTLSNGKVLPYGVVKHQDSYYPVAKIDNKWIIL